MKAGGQISLGEPPTYHGPALPWQHYRCHFLNPFLDLWHRLLPGHVHLVGPDGEPDTVREVIRSLGCRDLGRRRPGTDTDTAGIRLNFTEKARRGPQPLIHLPRIIG